MITSRANPKIKRVRKLQKERRFRHRESAFVVEGRRWLDELVRHSVKPEILFYTEEWMASSSSNRAAISNLEAPSVMVTGQVMDFISDTKTAPGILAVVAIPDLSIPKSASLILILDAVANPGNMGTMIRAAAAAGVEGLLLGPECVDAYGPKVIRGGMGAHLRLPIRQASWEQIAQVVSGLEIWLATADGSLDYTDVDWREPTAVIIGNEARGASKNARALAAAAISIPMHATTESLNAAVAASVILFEAARQRRIER